MLAARVWHIWRVGAVVRVREVVELGDIDVVVEEGQEGLDNLRQNFGKFNWHWATFWDQQLAGWKTCSMA